MKGLSSKFEIVLNNMIDGLGDKIDVKDLEDDKVHIAMSSKLSGFKNSKK